MRASLRKRLIAAVIGVVASLSVAWAMGPHGGPGHDPGRMLSHMAERLDLTEAQRQQVKEIVETNREASAADHQRLHELREQLRAMRGDFDESKAHRISDEIGDITGRLAYQAASTFSAFDQLLTEEQRAQWESLMEERGQRREHWHRKAPPPPQ